MYKLALLFILLSCGNPKGDSYRCLTKEEALATCLVDEINKGADYTNAEYICKPLYTVEMCYKK